MKLIIFLVLLFLSALTCFSQSKTEREVDATIKQWAATIVCRDMTALGKILADDIVITDYTGKLRGKAEELEVLKPMPHVKTISVDSEDVKIKVFGKTVVVTALTKMKFNIGGMDTEMNMRYTAVFVKRDGRWQIVALQTTRVVLRR